MKKLIISGLSFTFVILSTGCSVKADGPQFNGFKTPEKGKSNVYLYRDSYFAAAVVPEIHQKNLNTNEDKIIGKIKPYGYIVTTVDPAQYQIWAKTEAKNEVNLDVKPNKIYCIKHYISMGFIVGHPKFKIMNMEKCKKEIEKTRLSIEN
jgi:hypothetical protein